MIFYLFTVNVPDPLFQFFRENCDSPEMLKVAKNTYFLASLELIQIEYIQNFYIRFINANLLKNEFITKPMGR